ncbi:aminomethyl-transferring glycine dehydrogenase subunit GcvPA [Desulfococcaceae bacterium OttesenSCG-928-F15]|nr:aminomethyl-transferring glycine dehydrogenase subunit GcvPA [Desulfococcaceae bacterium OttesenSCG-928-F15]
MRYLPHTAEDISMMLKRVGASSLEALFEAIPENCRHEKPMPLSKALSEWELCQEMEALSEKLSRGKNGVFIGAGSYSHHIPALIPQILGRSEFTTAYTPYQPEISQGTLQAIFEYQTLTARLLGMEVANASMYDGASSLAEGLLMALRLVRGGKRVALSSAIHPHYREVVRTYFKPTEFEILELPYDPKTGKTDVSSIENMEGLAAIALQSPNFFGCVEDLATTADLIHGKKGLLVAAFTEPLAFGTFKNPGSQGADIVCGEGQSLGIPQSFGGPGLGMFASRLSHIRNMPGRLVGETKDIEGKRGFVLTLSTREQHIRREKATSNICSNQGLCAVASAMYMACLGGTGVRKLSLLNRDKALYLKNLLLSCGFAEVFNAEVFNEFVLKAPEGFDAIHGKLLEEGFVAGLPLKSFYPEQDGNYLFCATETASRKTMERLIKAIQEKMP